MKNLQFWQVSEVTVTYQNKIQLADRPKITCSGDAENILRANWSKDMEFIEEFVVLFLTRANQVKGLFKVSKGGTSGTVADPKVVFAAALKGMAAGIIVAHNHPSGNLQPSKADVELTRKLKQAGEVLDLPVLDHLILAPNQGFYSFADEGAI